MASDWIDTSGATPRLKPLAAVTGVLATIVYGWWAGLMDFIGSAGGGIWGTIDAIRRFLADPTTVFVGGRKPETASGSHPAGVIPWLFDIARDFLWAVASENATWLKSLGVYGIFVGFIEGVIVFYVLVFVLKQVAAYLGGGR